MRYKAITNGCGVPTYEAEEYTPGVKIFRYLGSGES